MDSPLELYHSCISETILAPSFLLFGKNFNIMSCLLVLPYTMEIANSKKKGRNPSQSIFSVTIRDDKRKFLHLQIGKMEVPNCMD